MLLALMLLGSLPFILPSGSAPEGPPIDKAAIDRLENELNKLEAEHSELIAKRGWNKGYGPASSGDAQMTGQIKALRDRIAKLSGLLKRAKVEADKHEKVLKDWEEKPVGVNLPIEISAMQAEIRVLKVRQEQLQAFVATRSGLPIYGPEGSKGRTPILADAAESRLYLFDERNYSEEKRLMNPFGLRNDVLITVTRKPTAQGEDSGALHSGHSIWHKELLKSSPDEHFVFVLVREDGFRVFLQARLIAQRLGFAVGWYPFSPGPITYRLGSGDISGEQTLPVLPGMGKQN